MKFLRNLLLIILVGSPAFVFAQAVPDPVEYMVAPEAPGPNQQVLIEAQGVGQLLGNSTITWTNNGKVVQSGAGLSSYTFTTGALGTRTIIGISINSSQGTFTQTFTFAPGLINLVWEAGTTVPAFYRGKALWSAGSPLTVVALPVVYSGATRVAASALSYQWSLNDEPQQSASGLGRNTFSFVGDQLTNSEDITVDAYYGATKAAHGEVVVPATAPALVLYEHDPLRGLLTDTAFPSTIALVGKEITLEAQPFYFSSADSRRNYLSYSWQLNGQDVSGPDTANGILTLRQTGSGQGGAQVTVALQNNNTNSFVQNASTGLNLIFGSSGSLLNNLFGL